jgi:hypothetical protein
VRLRLHDPVVTRPGGVQHLSATLTFAPGTLPEAEVRLSVEPAELAVPDASVLPFLPAALVLACRTDHDLVVDEPVPPAVHDGARQVAALLASWYGWRPAELIAPLAAEPVRPAWLHRRRGVGLFFTCGVDSWGSLVGRRSGPRSQHPTHLIRVDHALHHDVELREAELDATRAVAERLGLPFVLVRTDLRRVLDLHLDWGTDVHGSVLAGIGWLLRSSLHEVVISPTHWTPLQRPWGSHPDLDPRWSLPGLTITHQPGDEARWQRLVRIADQPEVLRSLQVCWQPDRVRNCGRCEKCLRTMTTLEVTGHGAEVRAAFDRPLQADAIGPHLVCLPTLWCDTIDLLDHVGLTADRWRQRWEQVRRRSAEHIDGEDRAIQPRLPVILADESIDLLDVGRHLARCGLRVDHEATPGPDAPALVVHRDDGAPVAQVRTGSPADDARWVALASLTRGDLDHLLTAIGADRDAAEPFEPDGQDPPLVPPRSNVDLR